MIFRSFLTLWLGPVLFFWGWYLMSSNDLSFGVYALSREMHDRTFALYAAVSGVPAEAIPPLIAKTLILDGILVAALIVFRRRRDIAAFIAARYASPPEASASADNLSKAP
ncbi:MAG: hypothetical protein H7Y08_12765 [Rhizobiaceae bacterium]|nr:hypothetical protein [Rhizobiaceae bacterium]